MVVGEDDDVVVGKKFQNGSVLDVLIEFRADIKGEKKRE